MKTKFRRILTVLLTLSLAVGSCGFVYATATEYDGPTITYDKKENTFTFSGFPGGADDIVISGAEGQEEYPNLFTGLSNMMPGDSVSQTIRFAVTNAGKDTVNLILRAEDPQGQPYVDSDRAYVSYYSTSAQSGDAADPKNDDYEALTGGDHPAVLTVTFPDGKQYNDTLTADSDGTLVETRGVYVGKFTGNGSAMDVTVDFELPIEAGNEYSGLTAKLGWVIVAEVIDYEEPEEDEPEVDEPEDPDDPDEPDEPDIDEPDEPDEPDVEDPDDSDEPDIDIGDSDVPLGDREEEEEPLEDIGDDDVPLDDFGEEDVPLGDIPATGYYRDIWLVIALASAAGLVILYLLNRRARKA